MGQQTEKQTKLTSMKESEVIKDFLLWMSASKICSVIPFFVLQEGRDGKIPHWTNGKKIFNADELFDLYSKKTKK